MWKKTFKTIHQLSCLVGNPVFYEFLVFINVLFFLGNPVVEPILFSLAQHTEEAVQHCLCG